jgi:hypothetical protein
MHSCACQTDVQCPQGSLCSQGSCLNGLGQACGANSDCFSGFCVEGGCCESACDSGCETCSANQGKGTCLMRAAGSPPRASSDCPAGPPGMCGFDGLCDGTGGCQMYFGTVCAQGSCDGDSVVGAHLCDGAGVCRAGPTQMLCFPFSCNSDTGACFTSCTDAAQCDPQHVCGPNSTCGEKPAGGTCQVDSDCISGFCADHICCNSACAGACVACNLMGRLGNCSPIEAGEADPRGICTDQGPAGCGNDGTCDGGGGCAKYAKDTQCIPPSCVGDRLNTAATCDGLGTCRHGGILDCSPFLCANGACAQSCQTSADCAVGSACVNSSCGPKSLGSSCAAAAECASNFCVDGVCCESACSGTCLYCALPNSPGRCLPVATDNVDPRGFCQDLGASECGTNGKCNGAGRCETYAPGTVCASETCVSRIYTAPSTCSATGQCVAPQARPCAPYACNGSQCFTNCSTNDQCGASNVCVSNSCGLVGPGAACRGTADCQTGLTCAQGVCCNSPCTGSCQSCALPGSLGTCTNVPMGSVDPSAGCKDQGVPSCGTNSRCDGNGDCQYYVQGTVCAASNCPLGTSTYTPVSICNGNGTCMAPNANSCFPYECDTGVCKSSCAADVDCASPAVCINGSCGLKGSGQTCISGSECLSGTCAQSVCCVTACTGTCQSCALPTALGTCVNVPQGSADPQGHCHDQGSTSCGTDGFCDGAGACREYGAGAACAPSSCPAKTSTLAVKQTCDGQGTCQAAATVNCAPYVCDGASACKATCTSDTDCVAPATCNLATNLCRTQLQIGQACGSSNDCLPGASCTDGVCCNESTCPSCQACNVANSLGTCATIPNFACVAPANSYAR